MEIQLRFHPLLLSASIASSCFGLRPRSAAELPAGADGAVGQQEQPWGAAVPRSPPAPLGPSGPGLTFLLAGKGGVYLVQNASVEQLLAALRDPDTCLHQALTAGEGSPFQASAFQHISAAEGSCID